MTKKQSKQTTHQPSSDNFLDEDELEMVSSDRHAWTFDQVIMVAESIPQESKVIVTWTVPNFYHTTAILRALAEDYDVTVMLLVQAALEHGLSIFENKHAETITLLSNLERTALTNGTMHYFDHSFRIGFGRDVGRYPAVCTAPTAASLTDLSGRLRAAKRNIAGYCILLSLLTDTQMDSSARKALQDHSKKIELTIAMQKTLALNLI